MSVSIPRKLDLSLVALVAWFGVLTAASTRKSPHPQTSQRKPGPAESLASLRSELMPAAAKAEAASDGRGRDAASPLQIPARGWWDILKRVGAQISAHRLLDEAAAMTYYALLAIFPGLAALVSIYGLLADPGTISNELSYLNGVVPGGGMDLITEELKRLSTSRNGALSFGAVVGLATALWSANGATKGLFDALNIVYDEDEKRSYFKRTLLSLGLTLGGIVFIIIAMTCVIALPIALKFVGLGEVSDLLLRLSRWPLLLIIVTFMLAILYRYGPSRTQARWRWVSWGGALAAFAWVLGSAAFSWYVSSFGSYNKTYGSLGAVIGFMTWLWISGIIVLIGAELDAEMEHQTRRDTTRGPEKPLGARGATKANTVAPAT